MQNSRAEEHRAHGRLLKGYLAESRESISFLDLKEDGEANSPSSASETDLFLDRYSI